MKSLDAIGVYHGADQSSAAHGYLDILDRYFERFRNRPILGLEIGIQFAISTRMWLEYFSNTDAMWVGVDCVDNSVQVPDARFAFVKGDAGSNGFWDSFNPMLKPFDIILDDASHRAVDQQVAFNALWPRLSPGGLYVIEDTQTWSDSAFDSIVSGLRWVGILVGNLNQNGKKYFGKPQPVANLELDPIETTMEFVHFWNGLMVIKKKG